MIYELPVIRPAIVLWDYLLPAYSQPSDSTAQPTCTFLINPTISIQTMAASLNSADTNNGSGIDQGLIKEPSWVLFVSGPTGSGKSSVARFLASRLGAHYLEGDDVRFGV